MNMTRINTVGNRRIDYLALNKFKSQIVHLGNVGLYAIE